MNNPEYVKVGETLYKINTDYKIAIECNEIAQDGNIGNYERALAIIYKLFGEAGLENANDYAELLEKGLRFLSMDQEIEETANEEKDMDYVQDMDYIEASFMSDYHINLAETEMHWWTFIKLMNGLSNSEFGNCCILNRIRNLRNFDPATIEDSKTRQEIIDQQEKFALKTKEKPLTAEQERSLEALNKIIGIE